MDAFAAITVILLLVCILTLIVVVVFFNPNDDSSQTTNKVVDRTQPGVKVVVKDDKKLPGRIYGADVNYPLSSSGRYYANQDDNNFWNNIYNQIYGQLSLDSTLSTVGGGDPPGSNAYIDPLLSKASGSSSNAFMDYDVYSQAMADYNPY